jgi:hypothetical protein
MKVKFSVAPEDIAQGRPSSPRGCPMAVALRRQAPAGFEFSSVGVDFAYLAITKQDFVTETPRRTLRAITEGPVKGFVMAFDDGKPVAPGEFELDFTEVF